MAMSFTSRNQAPRQASTRAKRIEPLIMKVTVVTVFIFVGSMTMGLI